jgi:hypothetical protein
VFNSVIDASYTSMYQRLQLAYQKLQSNVTTSTANEAAQVGVPRRVSSPMRAIWPPGHALITALMIQRSFHKQRIIQVLIKAFILLNLSSIAHTYLTSGPLSAALQLSLSLPAQAVKESCVAADSVSINTLLVLQGRG